MTLTVPDGTLTYAPQFEEFARAISDEDASRIETDPVVRSTVLRQAADLVEPDWLVVSGTEQVFAALPPRDGQAVTDYEFGEPTGEPIDHLTEVVRILADVRAEPLVVSLPDPATVVTDLFGGDWTALLDEDEFAALDSLHLASQVLTDVLREFEGNVDAIVLDASGLPAAMDSGLPLADYLLELGPVFNLADHYSVSAFGEVPADALDAHDDLREEFDQVVFESLPQAALADLAETAAPVGCSFPQELWDSENGETFRARTADYLAAGPDGLLLAQPIPGAVDPAYVQILGDVLSEHR